MTPETGVGRVASVSSCANIPYALDLPRSSWINVKIRSNVELVAD